jgi:hypothetical protein
MKNFILVISLIVISQSCARNFPPNYDNVTKQKYELLDVVNAIGILQLSAEDAVPKKILQFDDAKMIVKFCVDANLIISQTKPGWYANVQTAYAVLKKELPQTVIDNFGYAFSAFETVFASYAGVK